MSELKVDKITPRQGTTLTLGDSGDTINFGSGVLPNFENLTVTGDLTVDTNSLKVDSTNNFVGIGTASPTVALDVVGAITATGNITGTLATAAQPNITSVGTLTSATISGDLTVDTNTLYVDSTNNRVGIGTTSPSRKLHIQDNNSVNFLLENNSDGTVGSNIDLYHNSASPSTADFLSIINTSGNNSVGTKTDFAAIEAWATDYTAGSEDAALRIRGMVGGSLSRLLFYSSGELSINDDGADIDFRVESDTNTHALFVDAGNDAVLFGKSAYNSIGTAGVEIRASVGLGIFTRDSSQPLILNRTTNDGDLVDFRKDGTVVGSITSTTVGITGSIAIGTGDSGIMFAPSLDAVVPFNIGTNASRDTAIDLGYSTIRWKDLYLTGTVTNDGSGGMSIDTAGNVTFNEGGIDADFRVESDGLTHAFHLDGTDGRIGIGTTAISGARLQVSETSNGVFAGRFTNSHATGSYGIAVLGGNSSSNYTADFATKDGTSLMRIRGDGNVGIGTTSPATPLHLTSTSYPQFRITNAISFSMGVDSNNDLIFDPTSGSTRDIIFQNSGVGNIQVGIGTASPSTALEVAGTIKSIVTDNSAGLVLESTDDDAVAGPKLTLFRNSATPADGDVLGQIAFNGTNDNYPEVHGYARIESKIQDASNATEDGILDFLTSVASSEGTSRIYIDSTGVTINDASIDSDFRVESNSNTHMLFVDGGADSVGINTNSTQSTLFVNNDRTDREGFRVLQSTNARTTAGKALALIYDDLVTSTQPALQVQQNGTGEIIIAKDGATTAFVIKDGGNVGINTGSPTQKLDVNGTVKATAFQGDGSALTGISGGGKVLQVVSATKTDTASTTSTTYGDITGLSVSITPSSATSKIYVVFSVSAGNSNGSANYRLVRNTTALAIGDASGSRTQSTISSQAGTTNRMEGLGSNYLDSPSTTSATTYKVQWRVQNSGTNIYLNRSSSDADNESHPRGSSTITVMEIGA